MVTVTEVAQTKIHEVIAGEDGLGNCLRLEAQRVAPFRFKYDMYFINEDEIEETDVREDVGDLVLVINRASAPHLEGTTMDYIVGPPAGFKFTNPQEERRFDDPRDAELHQFIEEHVNPTIAAHSGHITLHGIKDQVLYLEMGGSCQGCGMAAVTLRNSVEKQVRERFPEIVEIVDVTNHAEGKNPFYSHGG